MWPAALTRLLRRRIVYIVLAVLLLVYGFGQLFNQDSFGGLHGDEYVVQRTRPLLWTQQLLAPEEQLNRTESRCRNSVQGHRLLADERGFVCRREELLATGCCNPELPGIGYYSCRTCNASSHCCGVYEYCVSCCLHPGQQPLLERVLRAPNTPKYIFASVADHFELCLVKCRTNSHSVEHENKYRDAAAKHCYGLTEAHESQRDVAPQGASRR
ncbi:SREBP regulating gene protein [Drosophila takahashii]|uniref:SREBP regulating gene protein n=1 Tax=Drosophila takahashii TaxID=29030 RepID=UPI001CF87580|nr:SREBP regulating gene protein [Drosophila takahashii]